jgi:hypothetical protein
MPQKRSRRRKATKKKKVRPPKSLFNTPSDQADPTVLADFAELSALRQDGRQASGREITSALERLSEGDEDTLERPVGDALQELIARAVHLGETARERYPFEFEADVLKLRKPYPQEDKQFLYLFLLLATRLNMKNDRQHARLDGAELFEYLSLAVAKCYWGGLKDTRVDGLDFGTARLNRDADDNDQINAASFSAAVGQLSDAMREGNGYKAKDPPPIKARDAKLDLAVWRDFADQCSSKKVDPLRHRHGKLIGFGQCKTGNTWLGEVEKLQPEKFCENWFRDSPLVKPIKLFFVSDRFVRPWHEKTRGMIFFDRCRILEYADDIPAKLVAKCANWTRTVLKKHKITWWD